MPDAFPTSIDDGFEEALAIVTDADAAAARLCAAAGFEIRHCGPLADGTTQLLGLGPMRGCEVLVMHPAAGRGGVRFVALDIAWQPLMRDGAQAWDGGGIYDINLRALTGIEDLHARFGQSGWHAIAPVTEWDFGPLAVKEVIERDHEGLEIALMERVRPPLAGFEGLPGPASWVFNSTQIVPDFAAARRLYVDALGWLPVQETDGFAATGNDGANCVGLPPGLASSIPMQIGIYQARGAMAGSVEVIAFGAGGRDFSQAIVPPRRGWAALRLAVSDLDGFARRALAGGCTIVGPIGLDWQPWGRRMAIAAITPWGARLEAIAA